MKILSIVMIFQGLAYTISSFNDLTIGRAFKYGINYYDSNFHLIGILIGVLLIISGVGIWKNKRKAYYLGLIIYVSLFFYSLISIIYFGIIYGFEIGMVLLSLTALVFLGVISRYIYREIQKVQ